MLKDSGAELNFSMRAVKKSVNVVINTNKIFFSYPPIKIGLFYI